MSFFTAYTKTRKERDDARESCTRGAYDWCDLRSRLRDTENELYYANERVQGVDNDMEDERKEFRGTIQKLNDQHLVDQEEIRWLKQHVSNTGCDRDEYGRRLGYASRNSRNLARENQKLEGEKQELESKNKRLEASLTEKDKAIDDLEAQTKDLTPEPVAAVSSSPIYIEPAADAKLAERDGHIPDLKRQNETLTSEVERLRTDLESLRDEHNKCSGHLQTQLAKKDREMSTLRAEKETSDEDSAETIVGLRAELEKKGRELEEANGALITDRAASTENAQRLKTLNDELETSREAHAQCAETSASQNSNISELTTANAQLKGTLRIKDDEIARLRDQVTNLRDDHEELQRKHARCTQHAEGQALQELRDANGLLQRSNNDLTQQLQSAVTERANLIREGQRVEQHNRDLQDLHTRSQNEALSLRASIESLTQTVEHQQQSIHSSRTICSRCSYLRAALDAVGRDVRMSDNESRAELRREVREELISQVPDDLRRRLRGEVEYSMREEFRIHYSDLFAKNSNRLQEQDREIRKQDAELKKVKNNPTSSTNHAACERKEGNLSASNTKLQQDVKILQGNCSRLTSNAQNDRMELNRARTANEDLKGELEKIKADQRRAQIINPLQSKLLACQRESDKMKVDRDRARDNCSIYSKNLSDLRKRYEALENDSLALREKRSSDGDSLMGDGCSARPSVVQNGRTISELQSEVDRLSKELEQFKARGNVSNRAREDPIAVPGNQALPIAEGEQQWPEGSFPEDQPSNTPTMDRDEAMALDLFRHEVDLREARDGKKAVYANQSSTQDSSDEADDKNSLPGDGVEKSDDELEEGEILDTKLAVKPASEPPRRLVHRPAHPAARRPTNMPVVEETAGRKRDRDESSGGEADDEGADDRKKVKMYHLKASRDSSAPAQSNKSQVDKDMD